MQPPFLYSVGWFLKRKMRTKRLPTGAMSSTKRARVNSSCHCEPARTLVWQSVLLGNVYEIAAQVRGCGLPHQSEDWFAMTVVDGTQTLKLMTLPTAGRLSDHQTVTMRRSGFCFSAASQRTPPAPGTISLRRIPVRSLPALCRSWSRGAPASRPEPRRRIPGS